jgi:hypothetical protein
MQKYIEKVLIFESDDLYLKKLVTGLCREGFTPYQILLADTLEGAQLLIQELTKDGFPFIVFISNEIEGKILAELLHTIAAEISASIAFGDSYFIDEADVPAFSKGDYSPKKLRQALEAAKVKLFGQLPLSP